MDIVKNGAKRGVCILPVFLMYFQLNICNCVKWIWKSGGKCCDGVRGHDSFVCSCRLFVFVFAFVNVFVFSFASHFPSIKWIGGEEWLQGARDHERCNL